MKKIFKIGIFAVLINFVISMGIVGYVAISIVGTSFQGTDIGITDLLKPHLSPDKASKLEKNMTNNSSKMGTDFAKKFEGVLSMFVVNKVDYSKIPATPYPYEDPSDKIKAASDEGVKEGLKILEQTSQRK